MVIIILAILTLAGIVFVLFPIFSGRKEEVILQQESIANRLSELNEHKKIIFNLLKDLEFEYKTGKISAADFEKLQSEYKNKVILIYQEIDKTTAVPQPESPIIINNG